MALDMRELHSKRKLKRRDVEALRRKFRMREFSEKVALQPPVRKRVQVPRRRPEMNLDADSVHFLHKMHMVSGNSQPFFRLNVKFLARLVSRKKEGTRRFGRHHFEFLQKRNNLFTTAIDPDIDVTALPDKRIGIQPGIGRPLQDGGPPPLLLEKFRKMRRLGINQAVMPADSLGFARPLEGEVQRRLPVLREFADARVDNTHNGKFGCQRIQKRPLFSGLYFKMCIILLGRTECEPKKGEKSFLQTRNQGLSQRVLFVRSEAKFSVFCRRLI